MKKKYFYYILLFLFNTTVILGQKVTLTPLVVNGRGYTSGPINLESTSTSSVSLEVKVEFPTATGNNGTINIYYVKATALGSNIPSGGNGGSLFFGGGKVASRQFVISLNWSDFTTSGGYLYAEYKNATNVTYKSNNISITRDGIKPPQVLPNTKNDIQIIPHGGTPLLPEYINFTDIDHQNWAITNYRPYKYITDDTRLYTPGTAELRIETTFKDGRIIYSERIATYVVNFLSQYKDLNVDNKINSNQYLSNEETPNTIIGNQASETHIEYMPGTRYSKIVTNLLNNYQWQTRIKYPLTWHILNNQYFYQYGWKDIPGATQINYSPPKTIRGMEYRRLILENPLNESKTRNSSSSNVVSIVPIINNHKENIICCDQTLTVAIRDTADTIVGDYIYASSFNQWQVSEDGLNWEDIFGANSKDFLPFYIPSNNGNRRPNYSQSKTQYYRRILIDYEYNNYHTSNTVKINFDLTRINENSLTILYPNPTTSILNIESIKDNLADAKISIVNATGSIIIPDNVSVINSSLISLNVSNLITGTYYINIENQNSRRIQLTFIKK